MLQINGYIAQVVYPTFRAQTFPPERVSGAPLVPEQLLVRFNEYLSVLP